MKLHFEVGFDGVFKFVYFTFGGFLWDIEVVFFCVSFYIDFAGTSSHLAVMTSPYSCWHSKVTYP